MIIYRLSQVERSGIGTPNQKIIDFVQDFEFRKLECLAKKRDRLVKQGITKDQLDVTVWDKWDSNYDYSGTLDPITLKDRGC